MNNRVIGTALVALGAVIGALGFALMVVLGPDGRFTTGPHPIATDGQAVVTAPTVIDWKNVEVEILAEVPSKKPIFVGLANSVDLQAYLKGVQRLEVTSFETPWKLKTREASGREGLPGAPTAVDWWRASAAGLGGAAIKTRLPDETVSAAILSVGSTNLKGLKVTLAYGIRGAFLKGLGLLLAGGGIAWAGVLARRGESLWETTGGPAEDGVGAPPAGTLASASGGFEGDESPTEIIPRVRRSPTPVIPADDLIDEPVDETDDVGEEDHEFEEVYVYVDEHGVEHEISAEEAAQYEVVEVSEVVDREQDPESESEPTPDEEQVTYFWVDEHGVEHEVSADELHEFEVLDEDDPTPGAPS